MNDVQDDTQVTWKHQHEIYNETLRSAILSKTMHEKDLMNININVLEQCRIGTSKDSGK